MDHNGVDFFDLVSIHIRPADGQSSTVMCVISVGKKCQKPYQKGKKAASTNSEQCFKNVESVDTYKFWSLETHCCKE